MEEYHISEKDVSLVGGEMTIKFKPDPEGRLSDTGKSFVAASTNGFQSVAGGFKLSLNLIKSARK